MIKVSKDEASWTFFSNYGHVYFLLANNKDMVLREVALKVGITERSANGIVRDLEAAGYIKKEKIGRSNRYKIVTGKTLRHPLESNVKLKDLVALMQEANDN